MREDHFEVIVIGAGIVGIEAADALARQGVKVLVLKDFLLPAHISH